MDENVNKSGNKLPRDAQLTVLWIARIDYAEGSGVNPHVHDGFCQLLIVLEGEGECRIDDRDYPIRRNHYYLFSQGGKHGFRFHAESITIDVKFRIYDANLQRLTASSPVYGSCADDDLNELKHWFTLSSDHAKNPRALTPYRIDSGFKGTLLSIIQRAAAEQDDPLPVLGASFKSGDADFPMADYLRKHLADNITLAQLADHFGYNARYLIKLFHDKVQMSPIQYLQRLRLEQAKQYLEFTSLTVAEISHRLGMSGPHFSRLFRRLEGISPAQYRRNATTVVGKDIILEQDFENEWRIISYDFFRNQS